MLLLIKVRINLPSYSWKSRKWWEVSYVVVSEFLYFC